MASSYAFIVGEQSVDRGRSVVEGQRQACSTMRAGITYKNERQRTLECRLRIERTVPCSSSSLIGAHRRFGEQEPRAMTALRGLWGTQSLLYRRLSGTADSRSQSGAQGTCMSV